jgi:hypothetical protein|tara:strand:- start:1383 stop:1514 length:132 start_codon:yes stop_codon:yes gene_type:complete
MKPKLQNVTLTRDEWLNALRVPSPYKSKKTYSRKEKFKNRVEY